MRFTIADTGIGMDAETRKRIYDSFFTTKGAKGTGIGLWVSANIVNRAGGSIHVRSTHRGSSTGTAFTIIFPDNTIDQVDAKPGTEPV